MKDKVIQEYYLRVRYKNKIVMDLPVFFPEEKEAKRFCEVLVHQVIYRTEDPFDWDLSIDLRKGRKATDFVVLFPSLKGTPKD
jgi:hypothetical protein